MGKNRKIILSAFLLIIIICFTSWSIQEKNEKCCVIHFLNNSKEDCFFIELPNGQTVLIHSTDSYNVSNIIDYIQKLNYKCIDIVAMIQPDENHIGGMAQIINKFEVGGFYRLNNSIKSDLMQYLIYTLAHNNVPLYSTKINFDIINNKEIELMFTPHEQKIVIKLKYGETQFLFTGYVLEDIKTNKLGNKIFNKIIIDKNNGIKYETSK